MKILLVYPKYPDTFWSFKHALKFIARKAANPPLGLLTVGAMLPKDWDLKLVDLNIRKLKDKEIKKADYVFISAMSAQRNSVLEVMRRCRRLKKKIVAGGPLFTGEPKAFSRVDHLILNEAEITLLEFLRDLRNGQERHIYRTERKADIEKTPAPRWDLIKFRNYANMNIQYSRGCPFNCEFCDITSLFGRAPRTKTKEQVLNELNALYERGYRGALFFVDDNFIGNKFKLKTEILPAISDWMKKRKYPFAFITEASINLADDEELMSMMADAGFDNVFIGIESPDEDSLKECNKIQNNNRDLVASVKKIQSFGFQVQGGFIVGFDNDSETIFARMSKFIQDSNIVLAMVGLLSAPTGTRLYARLKKENRILSEMTGDNTDATLNFIPRMNKEKLILGYKKVLHSIYSDKHFYLRVKDFLKNHNPKRSRPFQFNLDYVGAFFKSIFWLGIVKSGRWYYWKIFFWTLFRKPKLLPLAITFMVYGFHFQKIFGI